MQVLSTLGLSIRYVLGVSSSCTAEAHAAKQKLALEQCKCSRFFKLIMQSFTSVVGPNGSGKSNVIDAMLFVFGKRAKQVCCTKT